MGETGTAMFLSLFLIGGFSSVIIALAIYSKPKKTKTSSKKNAA